MALRRKKAVTVTHKRIGRFDRVPMPDECFVGGIPHPNRSGFTLIPALADGIPNYLPPVDLDQVPPDTYYVVDDSTRMVTSMASIDAQDVLVAWDIDREGRYFLRVRRALMCPRAIEHFYDRARVEVEEGKEAWNRGHPDWNGSLTAKLRTPSRYDDYNSPATREVARKRLPGASKTVELPTSGDAGKKRLTPINGTPKPLPKVKKSLRPLSSPAGSKSFRDMSENEKQAHVDDDGILTHKGVDSKKLQTAASSMADKYAGAFQPKKILRRK